MHWHDVSIPLREGMTVWPGDDPFSFTPDQRIGQGNSCNTSRIECGTHCGTHCDAPWHFEEGGRRLHEVDPQLFFGKATVFELLHVKHIRAEHLPEGPLPERVLFKTRNSHFDPADPFHEDFAALKPCAAERLVAAGVKLVGIDYLSIAPFGNGAPVHHTLLQNDVFVVEGLVLSEFPAGTYEFTVLPMALHNADGAPCRAFLGVPG